MSIERRLSNIQWVMQDWGHGLGGWGNWLHQEEQRQTDFELLVQRRQQLHDYQRIVRRMLSDIEHDIERIEHDIERIWSRWHEHEHWHGWRGHGWHGHDWHGWHGRMGGMGTAGSLQQQLQSAAPQQQQQQQQTSSTRETRASEGSDLAPRGADGIADHGASLVGHRFRGSTDFIVARQIASSEEVSNASPAVSPA